MTRDAEHTPTGYEDAASVVVNQAPAPSSLAGGEVEIEVIARAIDPDAWAHIDACHEAMKTCGEDKLSDFRKVIERRLHNSESIPAAERVIASLAALSPEAPALEGAVIGPWRIEFYQPPIPTRNCDWSYCHEDYDGPDSPSWMSGHAATRDECIAEIFHQYEERLP